HDRAADSEPYRGQVRGIHAGDGAEARDKLKARPEPDDDADAGKSDPDLMRPAGGDRRGRRNRAHAAFNAAMKVSGSTLPPEQTTAIVRPAVGSLPVSAAARAQAPPGSTTSLSSAKA